MNLWDFFRNLWKTRDIILSTILSLIIFLINNTQPYYSKPNQDFVTATNYIIKIEDRIFHLDFKNYVEGVKNIIISNHE